MDFVQFSLLVITIVLVISLCFVGNTNKRTFHQNLVYAVLCSILSIVSIFLLYSFIPENNIMEKLVQGEIIAGIAIAFPTIVL